MVRIALLHDFRILPSGEGYAIKAFGDWQYGKIITDGLDALKLDYSIPEPMEWEVHDRACDGVLRRFLMRLRRHPAIEIGLDAIIGMAWDERAVAAPVDRHTLAVWDEVKHLVQRLESVKAGAGYAERLAGLVGALVRDIPFLQAVDCIAAAPFLAQERLDNTRGKGVETLAGFLAARWMETFDRPDVSSLIACTQEALAKSTAPLNEFTFAIRGDVTGVTLLLVDVYSSLEKLKLLVEKFLGAGADAVYCLVLVVE